MMPVNVLGVGMHITPFILPAVAFAVPTPGVTVGPHAMSVPFVPMVLFTAQPALNVASIIPAAPNVPPAVVPPVVPQLNVVGVPTVLVLAMPATMLTTPAVGAGPPGVTAVPNVTNVLLLYATSVQPGTETGHPKVTADDLRVLAQSLAGEMVQSALLQGGVGYVSIKRFSPSVPSAVFHAVRTLRARGMTSLLLDLRGNEGGEMNALVQLAGDFLEQGELIATILDGDGDEIEYRAQQSRTYSCPAALLVDGETASAAEVFAGCLQAHGRAVIVGTRTYGKGTVQMAVGSSEGLIYATVATITLPDGRSVQDVGVEPDLPSPSVDFAGWCAVAGSLAPALRDAIASLG